MLLVSQTPRMHVNIIQPSSVRSYEYTAAVIGTPYTSDTLIDTLHRFRDPLQLLSTCIPQQLSLLHDLIWF